MMDRFAKKVQVLCIDDNPHVADALRIQLSREEDMEWQGWLPAADKLVERALQDNPGIVIIDIDMPGKDAFEAMNELSEKCPEARSIVFSGHVRKDLIEKAVDAGAWGYASKNDGEAALMKVLRNVKKGEFSLSPEVKSTFGQG